jgi:hypothetical protein
MNVRARNDLSTADRRKYAASMGFAVEAPSQAFSAVEFPIEDNCYG